MGMRLLTYSTVAALLLCLPYAALYWAREVPFLTDAVALPVSALHDIANFTHELGHAAMRWLTGYPALPTLDFDRGGGQTIYARRSMALLYLIWAACAAAILYFKRRKNYRAVLVTLGFALAQGLAALHVSHEVFVLFMGHGAELALAVFLALTGLARTKWHPFWRGVVIASGMYIIFKNSFACIELLASQTRRFQYGAMKGGKGLGDFSRVAELTGTDIRFAAGFFLLLILLALAVIILRARKPA